MEGLGYDDREISGLDTDTVGFTTGNGDRR